MLGLELLEGVLTAELPLGFEEEGLRRLLVDLFPEGDVLVMELREGAVDERPRVYVCVEADRDPRLEGEDL